MRSAGNPHAPILPGPFSLPEARRPSTMSAQHHASPRRWRRAQWLAARALHRLQDEEVLG